MAVLTQLVYVRLHSYLWADECEFLESIRNEDKIPLDPSIQSIFNCHSAHGLCQYYRPAHFFHPKCGIHSHNFQEQLQQMIKLKSNNELWEKQPPILIPFVSYMNEMQMENMNINMNNSNESGSDHQQRFFQRHNLSFIHVHKTGGTTIHQAMRDLKLYDHQETFFIKNKKNSKKTDSAQLVSVHKGHFKRLYDVYSQSRGKHTHNNFEISEKKTSQFLMKAVRYQPTHKWDSIEINDLGQDPSLEPPTTGKKKKKNVHDNMKSKDLNHMMIAIVRDPIERFISAVGQVTSIRFSKKGSGMKLTDECMNQSSSSMKNYSATNEVETSTTSDILKCFVSVIQERGYWVDVHFTPMILEISFATMQKDVPVAIFHFDSLPDVIGELGSNPKIKKKNGKSAGYRQKLLVNASIDDFDVEVLKELCYLYLMDVFFMRDLGYSTQCDSIVF